MSETNYERYFSTPERAASTLDALFFRTLSAMHGVIPYFMPEIKPVDNLDGFIGWMNSECDSPKFKDLYGILRESECES